MRNRMLILCGCLIVMASSGGAQTPDSTGEEMWKAVTLDPGYSVGWFDCVWREDSLYLATKESLGYYLQLICYHNGQLFEVAQVPRYDDSLMWKQGFYRFNRLDSSLYLLGANDTAVLRYRLTGDRDDRIAATRYKAGEFARKARIEPIAGFPKGGGEYLIFRSGDYSRQLEVDFNLRFHARYFLLDVGDSTVLGPIAFGRGGGSCDFFCGLLAGDTLHAVYRERDDDLWYSPKRKRFERTLYLHYVGGQWSKSRKANVETEFPGIFSWPEGLFRVGDRFCLITSCVFDEGGGNRQLFYQSSLDGSIWTKPEIACASTQGYLAGATTASGKLHIVARDPEDGRFARHLVYDGALWVDRGVILRQDEYPPRFVDGSRGELYLFCPVDLEGTTGIQYLRLE